MNVNMSKKSLSLESLRRSIPIWLALAAVSILGSGFPYLSLPYSELVQDGPNPIIYLQWSLVPFLVALAGTLFTGTVRTAHLLPIILSAFLGVPAVVMGRVAMDFMVDPTSHNLWPLELIIGSFPAAIGAGAGVGLGLLFLSEKQ